MIIDTEKEEQVLLDYSKITAGSKPTMISHYKFNNLDGNLNIFETAESYPSITTLFNGLRALRDEIPALQTEINALKKENEQLKILAEKTIKDMVKFMKDACFIA